jgi:hypothetical protein
LAIPLAYLSREKEVYFLNLFKYFLPAFARKEGGVFTLWVRVAPYPLQPSFEYVK